MATEKVKPKRGPDPERLKIDDPEGALRKLLSTPPLDQGEPDEGKPDEESVPLGD